MSASVAPAASSTSSVRLAPAGVPGIAGIGSVGVLGAQAQFAAVNKTLAAVSRSAVWTPPAFAGIASVGVLGAQAQFALINKVLAELLHPREWTPPVVDDAGPILMPTDVTVEDVAEFEARLKGLDPALIHAIATIVSLVAASAAYGSYARMATSPPEFWPEIMNTTWFIGEGVALWKLICWVLFKIGR